MKRFCRHCGVVIQVVPTANLGAIWMHKSDNSNIHYLECRLPPKVAAPPEEIGLGPRLNDYTACEGVTDDGR